MLFNSIDFALFLPTVFILYWFVASRSRTLQNLLVVTASYVFYGWWDWRFLSLILFSTTVDYFVGLRLGREEDPLKRKLLLCSSVSVNLGFLGFFKYYNFLTESFASAFSFFGASISSSSLNIILPVGISFYTLQTLSYTIDVYRKRTEPTTDFVAFAAFVSFFPQLVAGPIERAENLLDQFRRKRVFDHDKAADGLRQMLWGFFKKLVIADNCAEYADLIFDNSNDYSGSTLLLGALFFTFQIYGDFSGYSDIAIGTSKLFGFHLKQNFAFPYFSRDIAEFWRRWHISLSTWFRDYVYIPLGGSRGGTLRQTRNVLMIFILSGLWHGANWTFIAWGALNAAYFLPLLLTKCNRTHLAIVAEGRDFPSLKELLLMLTTFGLTVIAWILFRAENIGHAASYFSELLSPSLFSVPELAGMEGASRTALLVLGFVIAEWLGREQQYAIARLGSKWTRLGRWSAYATLIFLIGIFMQTKETPFIYFQF